MVADGRRRSLVCGLRSLTIAVALLLFFFGQTSAGRAQTAATDETPTATLLPLETETATPVGMDASPTVENVPEYSSATVQILIQMQTSPAEVREKLSGVGNVLQAEELEKLGVLLLEVPLDQLQEKMQEARALDGVGAVEFNDVVQALDTIPNDPNFGSQYALSAIRAPQGWDLSTGSAAVTIAILDSGVDLGHIDLANKIVGGYDFVNNDSVPQDDYGHGTHVAGIAAASGNNGAGMAGVSWGARIMPIKVLDAGGNGNFATVAAGIIWAADHGAQIINLSLGGPTHSFVLQSAVEYAYNKGLLLVAASGNNGAGAVYCPACYPQVMAVGATDENNQIAYFSNFGPEVDIAAPGQNIFSLAPGGYTVKSGTSMSAPHVSGLAAVLYSYAGNASAVRNAMQSSALDVGPAGWDLYSGAGLIQMDAAIRFLIPPTPAPTDSNSSTISSGNIPPAISPSLTFTQLPAPLPATPTQTFAPPIASSTLTSAPVATPTSTATLTPAPQPPRLKNLHVLLSPYPCIAIALILAGLVMIMIRMKDKG